MVSVTQGRRISCKNTTGGVKRAYLSPYRKLLRSEIIYDGVTLSQMPEINAYEFNLVPGSQFEQQQQENEGGKYYDTRLSLKFNKITPFDNLQFQKMLRKDYFLIVEDQNGNYFLMGFRNGATAESLNTDTTQYSVDFTSMEEEPAPYVTGIIGEDIIVIDAEYKLFQDGDVFLFQDDKNYIFQ